MLIKSLEVRNFRNYKYEKIYFSDGINILCGENAAGKTNLLEAIFYFAAGKSFRNCHDCEIIGFGSDSAEAALEFSDSSVDKRLSVLFQKGKRRRIRLGDSMPLKLSEYLGQFRAVIFTPDHLNLVKGAPVCRRRFMDIAISQSFPRYASTLSEYNRVIAQKNALLKRDNVNDGLLDVFNEKAANLSALITVNRMKYLSKLESEAKKFMFDISGGTEELELSYQSQAGNFRTKEELFEKYMILSESHKKQEKEKCVTLYGAHKDDFSVLINKKSARMYASQGQQRSCVLSLKLAEGELSSCLTGNYPVFLLDDILSELDSFRKEFILSRINGRQVVITGCEKELFKSEGNIIKIEGGTACTCS